MSGTSHSCSDPQRGKVLDWPGFVAGFLQGWIHDARSFQVEVACIRRPKQKCRPIRTAVSGRRCSEFPFRASSPKAQGTVGLHPVAVGPLGTELLMLRDIIVENGARIKRSRVPRSIAFGNSAVAYVLRNPAICYAPIGIRCLVFEEAVEGQRSNTSVPMP